jgi:hypothetical protein
VRVVAEQVLVEQAAALQVISGRSRSCGGAGAVAVAVAAQARGVAEGQAVIAVAFVLAAELFSGWFREAVRSRMTAICEVVKS